MKKPLIILCVCCAAVSVAVSGLLVAAYRANRDLREDNRKLSAALRDVQVKLDAVLAEKSETARQLALVRDSSENLEARLVEIEAARAAEAEAPPPVVAPYQVQAYLGQQSLGWVWIVPRNFRRDTNTQRYVYEPVVWLDESLRRNFVSYQTNVVEREVETAYINNSYYPQPIYYLTTRGHHRRGPSQLPSMPHPPSGSPNPPPPVGEMQPKPAFNPGSGVTTPQRLGTPAGSIKTRPQVLGTPAPR